MREIRRNSMKVGATGKRAADIAGSDVMVSSRLCGQSTALSHVSPLLALMRVWQEYSLCNKIGSGDTQTVNLQLS